MSYNKTIMRFAFVKAVLFFVHTSGIANAHAAEGRIAPGAEQVNEYLSLLKKCKSVGIVANDASCIGRESLLSYLVRNKVKVTRLFAPEHGLRVDKDANESFDNIVDPMTGVPIISLQHSSGLCLPTVEMIEDLDMVVFDIQSVGVRTYSFEKILHYVMEACAISKVHLMILDRPNPNAHYIDGPVQKAEFSDFNVFHPIPLVHGLTLGELAQMINGEGWLKDGLKCEMAIIKVHNYTHASRYSMPNKPTPNMVNDQAVALSPLITLFDGTVMSVGRGTSKPCQQIGAPNPVFGTYTFKPVSMLENDKYPKYCNIICHGIDLTRVACPNCICLQYLISLHKIAEDNGILFFLGNFDIQAGNDTLRQQLKDGLSEQEIRASWQKDIEEYKKAREKYLLYK